MTAGEFRRDVAVPFVVGMASLAWIVVAVAWEFPVAAWWLGIPGVGWCQWKLAPHMWGFETRRKG
jgi:hypothetical protein